MTKCLPVDGILSLLTSICHCHHPWNPPPPSDKQNAIVFSDICSFFMYLDNCGQQSIYSIFLTVTAMYHKAAALSPMHSQETSGEIGPITKKWGVWSGCERKEKAKAKEKSTMQSWPAIHPATVSQPPSEVHPDRASPDQKQRARNNTQPEHRMYRGQSVT